MHWLRDGQVVAMQQLAHPDLSGVRGVDLQVPQAAVREGYDAVRITAERGGGVLACLLAEP